MILISLLLLPSGRNVSIQMTQLHNMLPVTFIAVIKMSDTQLEGRTHLGSRF